MTMHLKCCFNVREKNRLELGTYVSNFERFGIFWSRSFNS